MCKSTVDLHVGSSNSVFPFSTTAFSAAAFSVTCTAANFSAASFLAAAAFSAAAIALAACASAAAFASTAAFSATTFQAFAAFTAAAALLAMRVRCCSCSRVWARLAGAAATGAVASGALCSATGAAAPGALCSATGDVASGALCSATGAAVTGAAATSAASLSAFFLASAASAASFSAFFAASAASFSAFFAALGSIAAALGGSSCCSRFGWCEDSFTARSTSASLAGAAAMGAATTGGIIVDFAPPSAALFSSSPFARRLKMTLGSEQLALRGMRRLATFPEAGWLWRSVEFHANSGCVLNGSSSSHRHVIADTSLAAAALTSRFWSGLWRTVAFRVSCGLPVTISSSSPGFVRIGPSPSHRQVGDVGAMPEPASMIVVPAPPIGSVLRPTGFRASPRHLSAAVAPAQQLSMASCPSV